MHIKITTEYLFSQEYTMGKGRMNWPEAKKKKIYYFQSSGFQQREKENPPGAKLPESARKHQEEEDMRAPAALEQEPPPPGSLNPQLKPENICPVLQSHWKEGLLLSILGPAQSLVLS